MWWHHYITAEQINNGRLNGNTSTYICCTETELVISHEMPASTIVHKYAYIEFHKYTISINQFYLYWTCLWKEIRRVDLDAQLTLKISPRYNWLVTHTHALLLYKLDYCDVIINHPLLLRWCSIRSFCTPSVQNNDRQQTPMDGIS